MRTEVWPRAVRVTAEHRASGSVPPGDLHSKKLKCTETARRHPITVKMTWLT